MATTRTATTHWEGSLLDGAGRVTLESSGLGTYDVTWASRAEDPNGRTSPEELIAAAHSSCFSMALSNGLTKDGNAPEALDTTAHVTFQPGEGITGVHLTVRGRGRDGKGQLPSEQGTHRDGDHARRIVRLNHDGLDS